MSNCAVACFFAYLDYLAPCCFYSSPGPLQNVGTVTLTTNTNIATPTAKAATTFGIAFPPYPLMAAGVNAIGDLFVTNFTNVVQLWIISAPIDLSALPGITKSPTPFLPCDTSQILHDEGNATGVCDIYLNGYQTLPIARPSCCKRQECPKLLPHGSAPSPVK